MVNQAAFVRMILDERERQEETWGEQNHPDGTGMHGDTDRAIVARHIADVMTHTGTLTWRDILFEEVMEALAEYDQVKLQEELVQVAAVVLAWLECIGRGTQRECSAECDEMHTERNFSCVIWRKRMGLV